MENAERDGVVARELQHAAEFLETAIAAASHDEKLAGEITAHSNGVNFILTTLAVIRSDPEPAEPGPEEPARDPARA